MEFHGWEIELEGNIDVYQSMTKKKLVLIGREPYYHLLLGYLEIDEEGLLHLYDTNSISVVTFVKEKHVKIAMMEINATDDTESEQQN